MATSSRSSGIGFLGFLTLIFIALKLAEVGTVATWSWFWVLSPVLIPWLIILGVLVLAGGVAAVVWPFTAVAEWNTRRKTLRDFT